MTKPIFNNPPICSVLIPSLGRFDKLLASVKSIFETAHGANNIEALVRLHLSDDEAQDRAHELFRIDSLRVNAFWGGDKPVGAGNEWLWNKLRPKALGLWHQYWSDDMVMTGGGWDTMLINTPAEGIVVHPEIHQLNESVYQQNEDGPVPFIPFNAFERYGYTELPTVPDKAVYDVLVKQHGWAVKFLPGIGVKHDRVEDATTAIAYAS